MAAADLDAKVISSMKTGNMGLFLVRLGSLAPIPIGDGSLGGAAGDGERGGVSGSQEALEQVQELQHRLQELLEGQSPPHDPETHQNWTHHQSQSHPSLFAFEIARHRHSC